MLIGYARVSTDDQHLDLQRDALVKAGCERVFDDTASGAKAERTGLTTLLATLRHGDTVVIWRLDRLGRPLKDLIYLIERLDAAGVGLRSLQESETSRFIWPNNKAEFATMTTNVLHALLDGDEHLHQIRSGQASYR